MSAAGARVLVADSERPLRQSMCSHLRAEGMQVLEADTGLDALSVLRRGAVDIALIDVVLPEIDGLELVRRVRLESTLPIILVAERGEEATCIAGLSAGADDYIVKPVSMAQLSARINAQLRRAHGFGADRTTLRNGVVELDLAARRCRIDGHEVELTRREFDLLSALLRYAGRIHTREQLLELVWGGDQVSSKTIDVHVAALRRKLGSAVSIATLRGIGYRLDPIETAV